MDESRGDRLSDLVVEIEALWVTIRSIEQVMEQVVERLRGEIDELRADLTRIVMLNDLRDLER